MQNRQTFTIESTDGIWDALLPDFSTGTAINDYHVLLNIAGHTITVDISSSPGGNIEGGYESTLIRAAVASNINFHFVLYPEDFLNKIGKLFGLQDEVLGYPEFDNRLIVKTDNVEQLRSLFSDQEVRAALQHQSGFSFSLDDNDESGTRKLDLSIQRAIIDLNELKKLLLAFYKVLATVESY